ncbi:MAG TPA: citrate synthase [Deltaproteobacteria bacterium]|nr:citrate synthase [Deltaproteobacteria bacterium]
MEAGLEGINVAATELSEVDGAQGTLCVRGVPVAELARRAHLEDAIALLWDGALPGPDLDGSGATAGQERSQRLGAARVRAWPLVQRAHEALSAVDGMVALRGGLSLLDGADDEEIVASVAVLVAAWGRRRRGLEPLEPDPALDHAADLHRMITGIREPAGARALGRYLCTVAEHGMNASTFTARVVASTGSDPVSAVVAALGALKGPLHGGAPGPVLDMLEAVGTPEQAVPWIEAELAAGRRIMGMGHRVYRVRDPRAAVLEEVVTQLEAAGIAGDRLALARAVEAAAGSVLARHKPGRTLAANVEFYTAVLLDAVGMDRALFTPLFACGRVVGWLAHVAEQRASGRMIRPKALYVGPRPPAA